MPKQLHLEDREQQLVINWAALQVVPWGSGKIGDDLFAIPNGGARRPVEAMILKACGVRAGMPDLCYARAIGHHHGLYIEMKKPRREFKVPSKMRSAVSKEQADRLLRLQANGYAVAICFGFDEARRCISQYLLGKWDMDCNLDPAALVRPIWGPTTTPSGDDR